MEELKAVLHYWGSLVSPGTWRIWSPWEGRRRRSSPASNRPPRRGWAGRFREKNRERVRAKTLESNSMFETCWHTRCPFTTVVHSPSASEATKIWNVSLPLKKGKKKRNYTSNSLSSSLNIFPSNRKKSHGGVDHFYLFFCYSPVLGKAVWSVPQDDGGGLPFDKKYIDFCFGNVFCVCIS